MGKKAHLARELETMLASDAGSEALGQWLTKNAKQIRQSLVWADDMVEVQEIDLNDMSTWPESIRPKLSPRPQRNADDTWSTNRRPSA
jgi:hypothetical protein